MKSLSTNKSRVLSRREALRKGGNLSLLLSSAASANAEAPQSHERSCSGSGQLAPEHTIVTSVSTSEHFIHDPGMTRLPSGRILVVAPRWHLDGGERSLLVRRSGDGGNSWESLPTLPFADATPFVVGARLYMFVQPQNWKDVYFTRSDDEGKTWAPAVKVFEGSYWNCCTGMVITDKQLFWALDSDNWNSVVAIAADLSRDLLDPSAWRMSNPIQRPATPSQLTRGLYPPLEGKWSHQWKSDVWLEPNVVAVNGKIRVMLRMIIDEYATSNVAAICDVTDDGNRLDLKFGQLYPLPGGQNKFFIMYDSVSRLYWMLSNLVTDSQDTQNHHDALRKAGYLGGPGNERRTLALSYSLDALNWFSAGIVSRWPGMLQSFMYPAAAIDGEDIIFTSRTSEHARNQHDADHVTFHRVRDFRSLAMDLHTGPENFIRKT